MDEKALLGEKLYKEEKYDEAFKIFHSYLGCMDTFDKDVTTALRYLSIMYEKG